MFEGAVLKQFGPWICIWDNFCEYFEVQLQHIETSCYPGFFRAVLGIGYRICRIFPTFSISNSGWKTGTSEQADLSFPTRFMYNPVSKPQRPSDLEHLTLDLDLDSGSTLRSWSQICF